MPEIRRIAVLDDYQGVALDHAQWDRLPESGSVTVFDRHLGDTDQVAAALQPFDVIVAMRERTAFPADLLDRLANLRLLVTTGPGNASIDLDAARRRGIVVSGTRAAGIAPTAELTWGLIHALVRHIPAEDRAVREGRWQHTVGRDLEGKRLGVLGLGNAGSRVARIGLAYGMDVAAWSANLDPERARSLGATAVSKHELFAGSDIVSVHLKLSDRTRGIVGREDIAAMRPGALLINTSRAAVVDGAALLDALHAGAIGGAGLDVFPAEPLPADSPWRSAPRTVLTPHLGYVTSDAYDVFYPDAVEAIQAFAAGEPVRRLTG